MFSAESFECTDVAIVQCRGRLVRSAAAYRLRDAVAAHATCRIIVLDLSQVSAIEGGGLGMLVFLQRWTKDNGIALRLFNPAPTVRHNLDRAAAIGGLETIPEEEFLSLMGCQETPGAHPEYLAA